MTAKTSPQPSISDRLDTVLQRMVDDGMVPRAVYLTPADYDAYAAEETAFWNEKSGSMAAVVPLSVGDVPIINEKLIEKVEVPVRQCIGVQRRGSAIYAANGACRMLWTADV